MSNKKVSQKILQVLSWIITAIMLLIIVLNLYTIIAKKVLHKQMPMVFGYTNAVVVSGSMEGNNKDSIFINDMVIIHRKDDYEVNDVVTYTDGIKTPVTHRIIEKNGEKFITQGDANNTADPEIDKSMVVGKVVMIIPKVGAFIELLQSPLGIMILVLVGFLLIEWPTIAQLFTKKSDNKK